MAFKGGYTNKRATTAAPRCNIRVNLSLELKEVHRGGAEFAEVAQRKAKMKFQI
jgi:hypothetical protein